MERPVSSPMRLMLSSLSSRWLPCGLNCVMIGSSSCGGGGRSITWISNINPIWIIWDEVRCCFVLVNNKYQRRWDVGWNGNIVKMVTESSYYYNDNLSRFDKNEQKTKSKKTQFNCGLEVFRWEWSDERRWW